MQEPLAHFASPTSWTRSQRRAFLLTLPVSGPLWVLILAIVILAGGVWGSAGELVDRVGFTRWTKRMWGA